MTVIEEGVRPAQKRKRPSVAEFLVFTLPLLVFLAILYGTVLWNFYVSTTNWVATAPDYTFSGFKWYSYLFRQARFWVDVANNMKWLILEPRLQKPQRSQSLMLTRNSLTGQPLDSQPWRNTRLFSFS